MSQLIFGKIKETLKANGGFKLTTIFARLGLSHFIFFVSALAVLHGGCSHLKTAEFNSGIGEFDSSSDFTPVQELYNSDQVLHDNPEEIASEFSLQSPVKNLVINRGFNTNGPKRDHLGLDIKGRKGDPILAAHHGTVIYAGSGFRGYGKMVLIEYNKSWATLYAHLSRINVKTGAKVKAGSKIGQMGRTGRATGVHLHFELMYDKVPIDPLPVLQNGAPMHLVN